MRTDPRRAGEAGFTLIETIVVLVVLALVAGLVVARGPMRSPTVSLRSAAEAMLQGLRATRAEAIASGAPRSFAIDASRGLWAAGREAARPLPAGVSARLLVGGRTARAIDFQPDGSSSGGVVRLATVAGQDTRTVALSVDWLTGRMRIRQGDAEGDGAP